MNILFIITIILASLLEYIGDSNFKFYARELKYKYFLYGIIAYCLMVYILIKLLRYSNVMYMNLNWDAISIVLETILAYYLLKEKLDNIYQIFGFVLIVIGIVLLNVGNIPY